MTEPEAALLATLVEAARSVPVAEREAFTLITDAIDPNWTIFHKGLPGRHISAYPGDVRSLEAAGMLRYQNRARGRSDFDLTDKALRAYESLRVAQSEPYLRVEEPQRRYLDSIRFKSRHPKASARWGLAEELLWRSDTAEQHTAIGHHCREAIQEFGTSLLTLYPTPNAPPEITATKNRIEAVLRAHSGLSGRRDQFLLALIDLWKAVIDLAQRQEHALAAPSADITWEDGRRLVQYTASVMYEVDLTLP